MERQSFIIKIIIGSILIGCAVAANYCQLCRNHVACRPKRGFGRACGSQRAVVPLNEAQQKLILQIHNGLRSVVASGLLKGFQPAKRMGYIRWNDELARLAAINARQCYSHYDRCRKTVAFPWAGQNVGVDRATNSYHDTNQSIYRITLKWFRQFEQASAAAMQSFYIPKNKRKRFHNFAAIVHDRQTHVGCAMVRYRKKQYFYSYLVCNYAVRILPGRKIYTAGASYTGCTAGRSRDFPSLCVVDEPIKAVPYPSAPASRRVSAYKGSSAQSNAAQNRRAPTRKLPNRGRTNYRKTNNVRKNTKFATNNRKTQPQFNTNQFNTNQINPNQLNRFFG